MKKVNLFRKIRETCYKWLCTVLAFASLVFLVGITIILFKEGIPVFKEVSFLNFIFGREWYPTYDPPSFGILPIIMASLWVTAGAMAVCVPLGIGSALYINELAGEKQKAVLKPMIELLAGVPSIVFGFFGMVVVAPFLQRLFSPACRALRFDRKPDTRDNGNADHLQHSRGRVKLCAQKLQGGVACLGGQQVADIDKSSYTRGRIRHIYCCNTWHEQGSRRDHDSAHGHRRRCHDADIIF